MSKNKNQVTREQVKDEEVIEAECEIVETPEESTEEKKPNKALKVLKKIAPFAMIGGAIAAAFVFGRTSGADSAYLAMIEEDSEMEDDDEADETEDETGSED